jgi:4-aminobutyrate aminotransferase-like enzyme
MKSRTNQITKNIVRTASLQGCTVWRNNTMGVFDMLKAVDKIWHLCQQMRLTTKEIKQALQSCYRTTADRKGASDIIGFVRKSGKFIAIEIKSKNDKLTLEQEVFLKEVGESGLAFVVAEIPDKITFTVLGTKERVAVCKEADFITCLRGKL